MCFGPFERADSSAPKHHIQLLNALVFHGFRCMQVPFTGNLHGAVSESSLDLLQIDAGFAKFGSMGMPEAVEVEFVVGEFGLDDHRRVRHRA